MRVMQATFAPLTIKVFGNGSQYYTNVIPEIFGWTEKRRTLSLHRISLHILQHNLYRSLTTNHNRQLLDVFIDVFTNELSPYYLVWQYARRIVYPTMKGPSSASLLLYSNYYQYLRIRFRQTTNDYPLYSRNHAN